MGPRSRKKAHAPPPTAAEAVAAPQVPAPAAPHVLILEDEPVIASLLDDVLSAGGYRVTQAHTVADALAQVAAHADLALCISDFLLPDRTGLDFARALQSSHPQLRIVLASAYLEPELVTKIEAVGSVVMIVRKPLDIFALRGSIDRLLGRAGAPPAAPVSASPVASPAAPLAAPPSSDFIDDEGRESRESPC